MIKGVAILVRLHLILCLSLCCFTTAYAGVIEGLYSARVEVPDQSTSTQNAAIRDGLEDVFVKVSGNSALLNDAQIKQQLKQAKSYLRTYRFEQTPEQLFLSVNFDQDKVDKQLRDSGYRIWDKRRPETIVWLAIKEPSGSRKLVAEGSHQALVDIAQDTAKRRGVEIVQPLLDLDDMQNISIYDVWGGFVHQLSQASQRYGVDNVFSARIYKAQNSEDEPQSAAIWQGDWVLLEAGNTSAGSVSGAEQAQVVDALVNAMSDTLAAKYAIDFSRFDPEAMRTTVTVKNLTSLSQYGEILKFFNSLSVVSSASLVSQQGQLARFELNLLGEVENLIDAIGLDKRISPVNRFEVDKQNLEYFWKL
ncbi:DUF2066 domain-containing protein [Paraglaciecola chathamensis]|uniref:DUF2066 domain-containing protein n=1 Tax=Paraglaciecola chathamensis TaxID=368405 RepID=UPI0026F7EE8F|nr:DUF2066 domain-containing protein [Paraglaciecola chathamensis]MDO6558657.1 DUF2066 domain-containing protein [Paraglaciecola chathamensis]